MARKPQSASLFASLGRWWLAEARAFAGLWRPDPAAIARGDRLVVTPAESAFVFEHVRARGRSPAPQDLAREAVSPRALRAIRRKLGAKPGTPLFLSPPPERVFSHRMMLPAATAAAAPALVADVVRRKTPLDPDQFHAASALEPSIDPPGKALLRIALVPKAWVAEQLHALGLSGDDMAGLLVADGSAAALHASLTQPRRALAGFLIAAALLLSAAAGLAAAGWAAWSTWEEGSRLESEIARIAPKAREAMAQSRAAGETGALVEALRQRKDKAGVLAVWRELTQLLPSDTFVLDLQVGDREIAVTGYSASASALIPRLEQSTLLTDIALTGAVVFDALEGRERFTLRAAFRAPQPPVESLR